MFQLYQAIMDKTTTLKYNPNSTVDLWQTNNTMTNKWIYEDVSIDTTKPFKVSKTKS